MYLNDMSVVQDGTAEFLKGSRGAPDENGG